MSSDTKVTAKQARYLYQSLIGPGKLTDLHGEAIRGVAAMKIFPRLLHNILHARKEDGNDRLKDETDVVSIDHFESELDDKINELEWWLDVVVPMVEAAEEWLKEGKV
jgi:hypothetical protein